MDSGQRVVVTVDGVPLSGLLGEVRREPGDHECWWRPGQAGLDEVAALFTAAPRVVTDEQTWGGHNLSLGRSATAYHLKVLAFVEECILARKFATPARKE